MGVWAELVAKQAAAAMSSLGGSNLWTAAACLDHLLCPPPARSPTPTRLTRPQKGGDGVGVGDDVGDEGFYENRI